jgi:thioredoxin 1
MILTCAKPYRNKEIAARRLDDGAESSYLHVKLNKEPDMATVKVTDDSFKTDVIGASQPVLLDFWAEWCGPCKQMGPGLEELSEQLSNVTIAKLNIDDNPETPTKFHVRGIPTLMIFKDGQVVATKVGAMTKSKLEEWVKENT